jgi:hypothetical protein
MIIINSTNSDSFEEINSGVILVPVEIVARSHPSSHSVPIIRARATIRRPHVVRNLVIAVLASQLALAGVFAATYYSIQAGEEAGYKLACVTVGLGRGAHPECHWEKL